MRRVLALLVLSGCAAQPPKEDLFHSEAVVLCADPGPNVGRRVRIPVALGLADFSWGLSTLAVCLTADGGPVACCNGVTRGFRLPCGDPASRARFIELVAAPTLALAATGVGPYAPALLEGRDAGTRVLGCLGCDVGVSCSPSEPARVRAVWGALEPRAPTGYVFAVDALEQ